LVLAPHGSTDRLPGIVFLHGGGMIFGSNMTRIEHALHWMTAVPSIVMTVGYRLAPEYPHPAPSEDCYSAVSWFAANADQLGFNEGRLIVGGTSAGGGLAAATALMARDRGGPALLGQMLISPMLDDRAITPSSTELDGEGFWDRTSNATGWSALLGQSVGGADVPPYAAPARAADLTGLPQAYLEVGSVETFRDETVEYAQQLWLAGVQAELHVWPGAFHGFDSAVPTAQLSIAARRARTEWLQRTLNTVP
jgi:acetyl esterase/lipase